MRNQTYKTIKSTLPNLHLNTPKHIGRPRLKMTTPEDRSSSIVPFLPVIRRGTLFFWPPGALNALKALSKGPGSSLVESGETLYDSIVDLRHEVNLKDERLKQYADKGYALFFDDLIPRADSRRWFGETLPRMAGLLLRFPGILEEHYKKVNDGDVFFLDGGSSDNSEEKNKAWGLDLSLRVLQPQQPGIVLLSQELIGAILACSFFCLFPKKSRWDSQLPAINFDGLFAGICTAGEIQENKIKCIVHYFERICTEMPHGSVSFERKVLPVNDNNFSILYPKATYWSESKVPLCALKVIETGTIEDHEQEALEVDFANKYLGGGALNIGCVQEEIRFMINPELIAGMLFCPVMEDNEAIEIVGAERFSIYKGYASTFRFAGNYIDKRPRDFCGRLETRIVAIDALRYPGRGQFKCEKLTREVNKAYCGFLDHESIRGYFKFSRKVGMKEEQLELSDRCQRCRPENKLVSTDAIKQNNEVESLGTTDVQECSSSIENDFYGTLNQKVETAGAPQVKDEGPNDITQRTSPGREKDGVQDICSCLSEVKIGIATGNWGCGAFGGDVELKSMLQWLAASQAFRPFVLYFTFGEEFSKRLIMFTEWITCHCWTVGELWDMLIEYSSQRLEGKTFDSFFQWVLPQLNGDPRGKE